MRRSKNLIIMGAVLLALVAVILVLVLVNRHVDSINTVDEIVLTVDADSLSAVSWEDENGGLSFTKGESGWLSDSDEKFPVNQDTMSEFLANFAEVHASFIITDVEDYSQYGLDDPVCTLTFTTADGDHVVTMGAFSSMDSKRYICINSGDVYLVDTDPYEVIVDDLDSFIQNDDLAVFTSFTEMEISGNNTLKYIYDTEADYTYTDAYCYYMVDGNEYKELSTSLAESFYKSITQADQTSYATYSASSEDLSKYGLDNPSLTVVLKGTAASEEDEDTEEEKTLTVYFGEVAKTDVDADDEDLEPAQLVDAYMRVGDSEIIYVFDSYSYVDLRDATYDDLRPAELLSMDWSEVTAFSATVDGETFDISLSYDIDSDTTTAVFKDTDIDFTDIKTAISGLDMTEFNSAQPTGVEELSITVTQNDETYPTMTVKFYRLDGESCVATRNDEVIGYISREDMNTLREAINAVTLASYENAG